MRHLLRLILVLGIWVPALAPAISAASDLSTFSLQLERIRVEPEDDALHRAVVANLDLQVGQPVRAGELVAARRTLELSGYFEQVDVYTERGSRPGAVVLVVSGTLDRSPHLESGFGHEPLTGWYLNLAGVRWNSPFHRGGYARLGARLGLRTSGFYAEAMRPRLGGERVDLLVELGTSNDIWLVHDGDDLFRQDVSRGRFHAGLRWHLGSELDVTFRAGLSSSRPERTLSGVDIPDEDAGRLVPVPGLREEYTDLLLDVRWRPNRRDERWRDGRAAGLRIRGSDIHEGDAFLTAGADLGGAVPLGSHDAVAARLFAAYAGPTTPYHLRPTFGGTGSLRGYRDASLSGPLGARAQWMTSLEWRRRLLTSDDGRARVVGQLFFDVGQQWDPDGEVGDLDAGVGYGLRVRVPWIQVFGLDAGIPLSPTVTDDPFWVHATLGFSF